MINPLTKSYHLLNKTRKKIHQRKKNLRRIAGFNLIKLKKRMKQIICKTKVIKMLNLDNRRMVYHQQKTVTQEYLKN